MTKTVKTLLLTSLTAALCFTAIPPASAGFAQRHPRRAEVNGRFRHQQGRIANGVTTGRLNAGEAANLEGQEAAIKHQERSEVRANGGFLTKGQQRQLNQEQNGLSHEIYQDKHN